MEKTNTYFLQKAMNWTGENFCVRACFHFHSQHRALCWAGPVSSDTVSEFTRVSGLWCPEDLAFLVFSILTGSYNLSTTSFTEFPEPWGRDLMEPCCLGLSIPGSLILCIMSGHGLCVWPICCRREPFCWWLSKAVVFDFTLGRGL